MTPIEFPEANTVYQGEGCGDLPARLHNDEDGVQWIISKWVPTADELQALINGAPVTLWVAGMQPPVSLVVYPVDDEATD